MLLAEFKEFYSKWETEAGISPTVTLGFCVVCLLTTQNIMKGKGVVTKFAFHLMISMVLLVFLCI